jgi:hypothetical protein
MLLVYPYVILNRQSEILHFSSASIGTRDGRSQYCHCGTSDDDVVISYCCLICSRVSDGF